LTTDGLGNVYRAGKAWSTLAITGSTFAAFSSATASGILQPNEAKIDIYPSIQSPIWVLANAGATAISGSAIGVIDTTSGCLVPTSVATIGSILYQWPAFGEIYSGSSVGMVIAQTATVYQEGSLDTVEGNIVCALAPKADRLSYNVLPGTSITAFPAVTGTISKETEVGNGILYYSMNDADAVTVTGGGLVDVDGGFLLGYGCH
jgi:hypothetical protein